MRKGWAATTLGEVVTFKGGGTPSTEKLSYWNGVIPWVSPKDMKASEIHDSIDKITPEAIENSAASLIPQQSILIVVRSGILARTIPVGITARPLAVNQDIKALIPAKDVDPHYLHYFMQMSEPDILKLVTRGATVHRLSMDSLKALRFLKPSLPEQQRIVAILDEAFAGLATATANAEKNLKNARELFECYLNSAFVDRSEGCETRALGEVSEFEGGAQPPKSKFVYEPRKDYVRLLQIRDFSSDRYAVYIPISKNNRTCTKTDVMIGRYGASVGQIHRGKAGAYNVALIKTQPDLSMIDADYFYYYLRSNTFQEPLSKVAARSAQAGFSKDDINPFGVPLPSLNQQRKVVEELDAIGSESSKLEDHYSQRLDSLAMLKQSILQKAFSGELTSPPSQAIREAAE